MPEEFATHPIYTVSSDARRVSEYNVVCGFPDSDRHLRFYTFAGDSQYEFRIARR